MSNKGVRDKWKLSDKWEPVGYMMVASELTLHIYCIRDREGNEQTGHHNLLLQVNFLPLDVALDDDATCPATSVVSDTASHVDT